MQTEIRKGKGIEGLVGYTPKVEEARDIEATEHVFSDLYERYVHCLDDKTPVPEYKTITDILTPNQINLFLQQTILYENHPNHSDKTGKFLSQLIQNSYDSGKNNFTLNTTALKETNAIGYKIKGTPTKNIEITITGNTEDTCGWHSKNTTFNITGNTGDNCGLSSRHSTFTIRGTVGEFCGLFSDHLTYKTPNKETLDKLLKDALGDHKLIFIHPNGTEEIKRDY